MARLLAFLKRGMIFLANRTTAFAHLRTFELRTIKRPLAEVRVHQVQRALTSQLADEGGLEVISFQHCDCLVFERGEAMKLFLPRSKQVLGGTAKDRMIIGDMLVIFSQDLARLRSPSKRFKFENFVVGVPIANFPATLASQIMVDSGVGRDFFEQIRQLLDALPDNKSEWIKKFGVDFFNRPIGDRCSEAIRYMRKRD